MMKRTHPTVRISQKWWQQADKSCVCMRGKQEWQNTVMKVEICVQWKSNVISWSATLHPHLLILVTLYLQQMLTVSVNIANTLTISNMYHQIVLATCCLHFLTLMWWFLGGPRVEAPQAQVVCRSIRHTVKYCGLTWVTLYVSARLSLI